MCIRDSASLVLAIAVLSLSGLIVGWGIHSSLGEAIAGYGLLLLLAAAMVWVGLALGALVRSADALMGVGFLVVFPLTFLASTFVPIDGLPDGLRQVAEWNPISALAAAVRTLFGNPVATPPDPAFPLAHPVLYSVAFCVAVIAVFVPVTLRLFRRRTTD